ncbi:MAG: TspO/MBR family protein [Paracoccaceae bacterium]
MDLGSIGALAVFALATFAAACSGAAFTPGEWYERLNHPSWRPPNWVFPAVWTPLYVMIAASGFLVWQEVGFSGAPLAFAVYVVQLGFNAGWSALFFGAKRPVWALWEVAGLWLSIALTMALFWPLDATAGWLLVPYLAWVSFASYYNWVMVRLNPEAHRARA